MDDCIFCKIASGEIHGLRIYEDEETLAFMDIAMDVDGHILVIPKKHVKTFWTAISKRFPQFPVP